MELTLKKIDSTIKTIWTKSIQRDFRNNKIGFHESTLVSAFYFHLPPFIEQDRTLRIYLEYFYDKKRYDMVIFKKGTTKLQKNKWNRKFGDPWMIIEFKYHPKLEVDSANYDINKIRDLSNSISSIERLYFFSIDKNERIYRYIVLHGKW